MVYTWTHPQQYFYDVTIYEILTGSLLGLMMDWGGILKVFEKL